MVALYKFVRSKLTPVLIAAVLLSACFYFNGDEPPLASSETPSTHFNLEHRSPSTYFVRPDGGSANQCSGLVDAPYLQGGGSDCAWQHPFVALPPDSVARIYGGDTLVIAEGSYMMGYGAPASDACETDYPWDCHMLSVPSGVSTENPTRILGAGWDTGCKSAPELWGTERALTVLNLMGSSFVEIGCLEITDHASCAEDHTGGMACKKNRYPYGPWAYDGLTMVDANNVVLHDLRIHGLASAGVRAGRLTDLQVERVDIIANGWVGWEGDIEGSDHNSGTLSFRHWKVAWNGCVETYPEEQPAGCWAQTAGGYGDGVGTGDTGGHWIIEDSSFLYNTSDGLDLLYVRAEPSSITVRRTVAVGNAGNQIKTNGPTVIENSLIVGNCGYFENQSFTHNVDPCRANGNALSFYMAQGNQVEITNNTITSEGDCLLLADCDSEHSSCDGSERVFVRNNIFVGQVDFISPSERTCLTWAEGFNHQPFDVDYSLIIGTKDTPPCPGSNDLCEIDPEVYNASINAFDGRLKETSPAVGKANPDYAPADDISGRLRQGEPDLGAYETIGLDSKVYIPLIADAAR